MYDMNGNFQVKAVTHHFSQETGFITSIQPDALTVNDDLCLLSVSDWGASMAGKMFAQAAALKWGARAIKKAIPSSVQAKTIKYGTKGAARSTELAMAQFAKLLPDDDDDVKLFKETLQVLKKMDLSNADRAAWVEDLKKQATKIETKVADWEAAGKFKNDIGKDIKGFKSARGAKNTVRAIKSMTNALSDGRKAFKAIRIAEGILSVGGLVNPLSMVAALATTWAVETINEKYRRKKAQMQAVLVSPLMYQGRQYTAGINGHKGMVVGDAMGKIDSFLSGMGLNGQNGDDEFEWIMDTWNWLTDAEGKDYSISEDDIRRGTVEHVEGDGGGFNGWLSE
jgi:hypothetical protein